MILPRTICSVLLLSAFWCCSSGFAQGQGEWVIEALNDNGWVEFDTETHIATATNGVLVKYGGGVLTAQSPRSRLYLFGMSSAIGTVSGPLLPGTTTRALRS